MTVLSIILGALLIISGFSLMFTPLATFMGTGYFILILFFVFGIFGIVRSIVEKRFGLRFAFAIISFILGIVGLCVPGAAAMNDFFILFMAAAWFIVHGCLTLVTAINGKKLGAPTGMVVCGIILGIIEIILGAYSFAHPFVMALTLGYLIAFYFIEEGINMIVIGSALSAAEK